jgi:hypothetical protein
MPSTLDRLMAIVSKQSGIPMAKLTANSALYQDVRMTGDDVDEFIERLSSQFGGDILGWPWGRFTNLSEPTILDLPRFIWQLFTWQKRGSLHDLSRYERLELGHIAAVIDRGEWFEP